MGPAQYDLAVIGGGINGAGIARDAAGRGLSVLLVERSDFGAATSSSTSKLIHGGLRYLEHLQLRLVAEALAERETLLRIARHLVWPVTFIMPAVPGGRPRWAVRAGLFLYDHLARRSLLPGSRVVRLDSLPASRALRPGLEHGFAYSDCCVDDARLVLANLRDAVRRGARVLSYTECLHAARAAHGWRVQLSDGAEVWARALVNAAGPWAKTVLNERLGQPSPDRLRLVRGSHIVLPRLYEGGHAFLLQNADRRVVFMVPFEERFTLVGTTEVPVETPAAPQASDAEVDYLCDAVSRYLAKPVQRSAALWRYAGVRPLYDDGSGDPSAISRDYTLRLDAAGGEPPVLTVFGGKLTTYRSLAQKVMDRLAPYFAAMRPAWTAGCALPGADFGEREAALRELAARYPRLPFPVLKGIFKRHGSLAAEVLGDGALGEDLGAGLTERELRYFVEHEWAKCCDDVIWRRSKAGLVLGSRERHRIAELLGA
jgi:glycerol-3-phosphate dehydrogenase